MLRFTIRDVLWLTVLAAVLVTWWLDRNAEMARAERTQWHDLAQNLEKILEYEGYMVATKGEAGVVEGKGSSYSFGDGRIVIHGR